MSDAPDSPYPQIGDTWVKSTGEYLFVTHLPMTIGNGYTRMQYKTGESIQNMDTIVYNDTRRMITGFDYKNSRVKTESGDLKISEIAFYLRHTIRLGNKYKKSESTYMLGYCPYGKKGPGHFMRCDDTESVWLVKCDKDDVFEPIFSLPVKHHMLKHEYTFLGLQKSRDRTKLLVNYVFHQFNNDKAFVQIHKGFRDNPEGYIYVWRKNRQLAFDEEFFVRAYRFYRSTRLNEMWRRIRDNRVLKVIEDNGFTITVDSGESYSDADFNEGFSSIILNF